MQVRRLSQDWEQAVLELLLQDPRVNLFLLGFLQLHPLDRTVWFGALDGDELRGVVMLVAGRLAVPYCQTPAAAAAFGRSFGPRYQRCMVVGPRADCDALWDAWEAPGRVDRWYDQRLYVATAAPDTAIEPGFRLARVDEAAALADRSAQMEREDLGRDPAAADAAAHLRSVRDRILSGRTWVIEHEGELVFQINVGTAIKLGCQVGGTYVPEAHRGKGWATRGMTSLLATLLAKYPLITLHVNEANGPAVRVYERSGFARSAAYRLVTVRS